MIWSLKIAPWLRSCFVLVATVALVGCGTFLSSSSPGSIASAPVGEETNAVHSTETPLSAADSVKIEFSGNANSPPSHEEVIKGDGTITLGYIGAVKAAGKTPRQLQADIHAAYVPDYFVQLTVTVTPTMRVFWVGGEVKSPSIYQYTGLTTVTRAIQAAGDFTPYANQRKVVVTRASTHKREEVNCKAALTNPELDLPIYPGDQIKVYRRWF